MKRFLSVLLSFVLVLGTFFAVPYTEAPFAIYAAAADESLYYQYDSDTDTYCVAGLKNTALTEVNIPELYNDKPVIKIIDSAFNNEDSIVSVTIPQSITHIGLSAFYGCDALETVVFNSNLTQIGEKAFCSCKKLASITFADNSVGGIGVQSFAFCSALEELVLPEGLLTVGSKAFYNCIALNDVTVPSTLTSIGATAFGTCENLATARIKSISSWCNVSLGSADASPVAWATSVYVNGHPIGEELTIPDGIEEIKGFTFYSLDGVKNIYLPESVKAIGNSAFAYGTFEKISLNEGLERIGEKAFYGCGFTEITIPSTLLSIKTQAFYMSSVKVVNISSLADWCRISFESETANPLYYADLYMNGELLTELNIPEGVEIINDAAFFYCRNITSVTLPSTLKTISQYAFMNCVGFKEITIPENVTLIEGYAFSQCNKLTDVTINTSSATINENAFYNCSNFSNIHVPSIDVWCGLSFPTQKSNMLSLGKKLYVNGELQTAITIPEGVQTIKKNTFAGYYELAYASISSTVSTIEAGAFANCSNVTTYQVHPDNQWYCSENGVIYNKAKTALVLYPSFKSDTRYTVKDTVTEISQYAFYGSSNLTELVLPADLKTIDAYATSYCNELKYVFFLGSEAQWASVAIDSKNTITSRYIHFGTENHIESDNWEYAPGFSCTSGNIKYYNRVCQYCDYAFEQMSVPAGHAYVDNICKYCGNKEFSYAVNNYGEVTITKYNGIDEAVKIPDRIDGYFVTGIGQQAFTSNKRILSVYIPRRVKTIGVNAFSYSSNLVEIVGAQGIEEISDSAFSSCTALKSFPFSESLRTIGTRSFEFCTSLESPELPDTITAMGEEAFYYCRSIKHFTVPAGVSVLETSILRYVDLESFTVKSGLTEIKGEGTATLFASVKNFYIDDLSAWFEVTVNSSINPARSAENVYIEGKSAKNLVIPADVVSIPEYAFSSWDSIESVTITGATNTIGQNAFSSCSNLKTVVVQDGVESIGGNAFRLCKKLTDVTLADSIETIGGSAFSTCESLVSITLPARLKVINSYTFSDCTKLKNVVIPQSVTKIWSGAFRGCSSLEEIALPDDVENINDETFSNCTALKKIHLPRLLKTISTKAFYNCKALTDVIMYSEITTVHKVAFEGANVVNVFYEGKDGEWSTKKIESQELKSAYIHYEAFDHTPSEYWVFDENFVCGSTETFYKYRTCKYCPVEYERVVMDSAHAMQNNVCERCGYSDFTYTLSGSHATITGCSSLGESLVIPSMLLEYTVVGIAPSAFENNAQITTVQIPESVTTIGASAFAGCISLESIEILNKEALIDSTSFQNTAYYNNADNWVNGALCIDSFLVKVESTVQSEFTIDDEVTSIAIGAFDNCTGLTTVVVGSGVRTHGTAPFASCTNLKTLVVGDGVTDFSKLVGTSATLENLVLGDGISTLATTALSKCTGLKTVTLGKGLTTIPNTLFKNLKNLQAVTFEGDVTTIGSNVFYGCTALKEVYLPDSIESMGTHNFYNCTSLETVHLPANLPVLKQYTFYGCTSLKNVTIPQTVTSIGNNAFYKCSSLEEINLHEGITEIGQYAFHDCKKLTEIKLPNSLTTLGRNAIYGCEGVTELTIPAGITKIESATFQNCKGLVKINLPSGITTIGDSAFRNCTSLKNIVLPENLITLSNSCLRGCTSLEELIIPDSVTSCGTYLITDSTSLKRVVVGDGVTNVDTLFKNNKYVESVVIGSGVQSMLSNAFSGCTALKYLTIGKGMTSLPASCLSTATSLKYVYIPKNVTEISDTAFTGFTGTVICKNGSAIHTFAQSNNIPYILTSIEAVDEETVVQEDVGCIFTDNTLNKGVEDIVSTTESTSLEIAYTDNCSKAEIISTGATVALYIEGCLLEEYTVVVNGDLNGDGICDALDVALTAGYSTGLKEPTAIEIYAANGSTAEVIDANVYQKIVNKALL